MRDVLPVEVAVRRDLLTRILNVYQRFGFEQIETPVVEEIDRLVSSEGGENTALVYKILRRGLSEWPPASEKDAVDLGLRYDLTVPLARFFATNSNQLLLPFKSIQTGPVFRAERPQKGRYRQFTQCDIDILGESSLGAEIELVIATSEALRACEVGDFTIRVNDRRILESLVFGAGYSQEQLASVLIAFDKLDKIGVEGVHAELAKINDGEATKKLVSVIESMTGARGWQSIVDALPADVNGDALAGLASVRDAVNRAAEWINVELDITLVRGMGYYTGSIFEIQHDEFKGSIGGGGRYDRMIGKLSGIDTPAVGFSIGFERLVHLLEDRQSVANGHKRVALLYSKDAVLADVANVAMVLREDGDIVRTDVAVKNRKAQLTRLSEAGYTHWVELQDGTPSAVQPLVKESS
jgi:histidyl-tRNA synthetase